MREVPGWCRGAGDRRMRVLNFGHEPGAPWEARVSVYVDWRDWWIGLYRAEEHLYVCVLPCLVVRIWRAKRL